VHQRLSVFCLMICACYCYCSSRSRYTNNLPPALVAWLPKGLVLERVEQEEEREQAQEQGQEQGPEQG